LAILQNLHAFHRNDGASFYLDMDSARIPGRQLQFLTCFLSIDSKGQQGPIRYERFGLGEVANPCFVVQRRICVHKYSFSADGWRSPIIWHCISSGRNGDSIAEIPEPIENV